MSLKFLPPPACFRFIRRSYAPLVRIISTMVVFGLVIGATRAVEIVVQNFSFETPDVVFAAPYDTSPALPWQVTQTQPNQIGLFDNTPPGSADHISDGIDGAQVAFMFVGPGITMFQDLTTPGSTFEIGNTYTFTIGAGGSQSLPNDAALQLRLFYRDAMANKVTVALASTPFDPSRDDGSINHLFDYSVVSAPVQATDPWAGQSIGIEIATPGTPAFAYWDLDRARVEAVPEPSTVLLLAAGLLGVGLKRRRRA